MSRTLAAERAYLKKNQKRLRRRYPGKFLLIKGSRVGEWSGEGEWLGQRRTRGRITGWPGPQFYPVGPDELYRRALGSAYETSFGTALRSLYVGLNSRGETGDTLPELPDESTSAIFCESAQGILKGFTIPFAPSLLEHPGRGGVMYSALTSDYRIAVTRNHGADTLRLIRRPLPAEPVTDAEWEERTREFEEWRAENRSAECEPSGPTRYATKPILGPFYIATDGKLWVLVRRAAGDRWEVFDAGGRLLASVPAPPHKATGVAPAFGPSDHLLTIRRDSLDLDHVDVWRLERGSS